MFPDLGEVTFLRCLAFGAPMVVLYLPLAWLYLTRRLAPLHRRTLPGSRASIEQQRCALVPMSHGEKVVLATLGFMLLVSTPPNAIVSGTGYIRVPEMVRAGIWLDLAGALLVTLIVRFVSLPLLGIPL